jgi:hypothetical protein
MSRYTTGSSAAAADEPPRLTQSPPLAVSRFMGSSIAMIELPLRQPHPRPFALDGLALERAVDAGWTPLGKHANPVAGTIPGIFGGDPRPSSRYDPA